MRSTFALLALLGCAGDPRDAAPPPRGTGGPVVLELFTSQGCSSCPPADRLVGRLAPGDTVAGREVIVLAFHVDYWNDLGWTDPFSSPAWSDRQAWYAARLPRGRVYTPAIVVGGRDHAVGSRRGDLERLVAAAPAIAALDGRARRDGDTLRVNAARLPGAITWAAVVEDGLVTDVTAGENHGAALRDSHVVRALVEVDGEAAIRLDPTWGPVRVVAFAQEEDGPIVAAAALQLRLAVEGELEVAGEQHDQEAGHDGP
jgi:hypothetical protein